MAGFETVPIETSHYFLSISYPEIRTPRYTGYTDRSHWCSLKRGSTVCQVWCLAISRSHSPGVTVLTSSNITPHPSLVTVSARVESGMKTDCDNVPTDLLKSYGEGWEGGEGRGGE